MSLGTFGGSAPPAVRVSAGGSAPGGDLLQESLDLQSPSPQGMPATTPQFFLPAANYGINLIKNGDFESWSGGTAVVPDAWAIAGGTVAKETTDIQRGGAACDVTATLNTVCDLSQTLTISATQNAQLRGRTVTFSARVLCATASRVRLLIEDGVVSATYFSAYHTGSGVYEDLFVTVTLSATATQLYVSLEISSGAVITATIDAAMVVEGATSVAFSMNPSDQHLRISNMQSTAPANATDQGVWRAEIGSASGSASADVTVTFETAFRTFRIVLTSPVNAAANDSILTNSHSSSIFKFGTYDNAGGRKAFEIFWMAIGQV